MASDLFERLAELEVPPPPPQFDDATARAGEPLAGDRRSSSTWWSRACPGRWCTSPGPLVAAIGFTITGRYETSSKNGRRKNGR